MTAKRLANKMDMIYNNKRSRLKGDYLKIKNMQKTKGFTLIELLVVIAIIGILSGLIIVSMSGAQNAAKDARIKASMDQMRSVAAIYYNTTGGGTSYGTAATGVQGNAANFSGVTDGLSLYNDMGTQTSGARVLNIQASPAAYCFSVVMNSGTYCVDSAGKVGTTACGTAYACP